MSILSDFEYNEFSPRYNGLKTKTLILSIIMDVHRKDVANVSCFTTSQELQYII